MEVEKRMTARIHVTNPSHNPSHNLGMNDLWMFNIPTKKWTEVKLKGNHYLFTINHTYI